MLRELDLSSNRLYDAGGEHLGQMLGTVVHFWLYYQEILRMYNQIIYLVNLMHEFKTKLKTQ